MKRVLFLATELGDEKGGIAQVNRSIVESLTEQNLVVISLHDSEVVTRQATVICCAGSYVEFAWHLLKLIWQVDLVIAGHVRLLLPVLLLPLPCKAAIFGHGSEVTHRLKPTSRLLLRKVDRVLANSERTARRISEHIENLEVTAVPLGMTISDGEMTQPQLKAVSGAEFDCGSEMLLLVGRMDPNEREKGHPQVLEAVSQIVNDFPGVQVVFAGGGDDQVRLGNVANDLDIAERTVIQGPLLRSEINWLFRHCFAFVMPSQQEGFGLVYLEAMSQRKPCIGCANDGAEDVIVDRETGRLLQNQDDIESLAALLVELLSDTSEARAMGEAGYRRVQEIFSHEAFAQRFRRAIGDLL